MSDYGTYYQGGSTVSIVTHYGIDGSGFEPQWRQDFPHPSRPVLGHTQPPLQQVVGLFPSGTAARIWH